MADPAFTQNNTYVPRQVGGRDSIKLLSERKPKRKARIPSAPSIPSRYETKLITQRDERDAFFSRTPRFAPLQPITRAGPGTYDITKESGRISLLKTSDSLSRKGYGSGFVSGEERFRHSFLERAENGLYTPGPGYYSQMDEFTRKLNAIANRSEIVPFNTSAPGVLQANPAVYRATIQSTSASGLSPAIAAGSTAVEKVDVPGPGSYNIPGSIGSGTSNRLRVVKQPAFTMQSGSAPAGLPSCVAEAFLSTAPRFTSESQTSAPAPGQYDVQGAYEAALPRSSKASGATSVFRSRTSRIAHETLSTALLQSTPGPGTYDIAHAAGAQAHGAAPISILAEKEAKGEVLQPSSSFAPRSNDRFGRPLQPRVARDDEVTPGPGAYSLPPTIRKPSPNERRPRPMVGKTSLHAPDVQSTATSSPRSLSLQGPRAAEKAPGPGSYAIAQAKDSVTTKRSFHLNTQYPAVWVV